MIAELCSGHRLGFLYLFMSIIIDKYFFINLCVFYCCSLTCVMLKATLALHVTALLIIMFIHYNNL